MALDSPSAAHPARLGQGRRILVEGETCWRIARADRLAVIIDAAEYFREVKRAILHARHSVLMVGWDFDTRIELERERPQPGVPNRLLRFLDRVVRRTPGLRVYVLRWDLAFLKRPSGGAVPIQVLDWITTARLRFKLDAHHPPDGCHHQKIVVIDDSLAFCGGIDITTDRWDTPEHRDHDPRRRRPGGGLSGPWHDATVLLDGPAAAALGVLARDRWQAATGEVLQAPEPDPLRWPDTVRPAFRGVDVAIARTEPAYQERAEVREIEALYLAAIAAAQRSIYLESQYFSSPRITDALAARLAEPDGPELVIVNPKTAEGWLEEEAMGSARALLLRRLRASDTHGRLRFCTPVAEAGTDIYVHAKVLVIDDRLLRVGSSNINNRSLGLDTECDLAVEAVPDEPWAAEKRAAILEVRDTLLAEHLGCSRAELERTLRQTDGSITAGLDRLMRPLGAGKTLVAFQPPELNEVERALAESHLLDPSRPEGVADVVDGTLRTLAPAAIRWFGRPAAMLATAGILVGLGLLAGRRVRREGGGE